MASAGDNNIFDDREARSVAAKFHMDSGESCSSRKNTVNSSYVTTENHRINSFVMESSKIDNQIIKECKKNACDINNTQPILNRSNSSQSSTRSETVRQHQVHEALQQWNEIVCFCRGLNIPFVDDSFPPNAKSLTFTGRNFPKVASWLRPNELLRFSTNSTPWTVFRNPRPSDIIQGVIGNCWFLSALAVVCEKPELLKRIMITKEVCEEGVYQVRICKNGKWIVVLVDDFLACDNKGRLVYSQSDRNQLWVPLIEKAVAKSVGCYDALVAGRCIEGLQTLTGMPCESIWLKNKPGDLHEDLIDKDMVWAKLLSCRNAGYLMGASCGGDVSDQYLISAYHEVGLEAQHAYSVLDIQQVDEHRLIRLRNPWGRFSWKGAWSDYSPLWTDKLKNALRVHGSDEGVFWMSLEDMMNYFDSVDVCKYKSECTEVTLEGLFASPSIQIGQVCHLTVFVPTELDLTLFQESNRGSQSESIASLDLMIGVYTATTGTSQPKPIKYIAHSERKIKPSVLCNVFLDIGVYIIVPTAFNHWNNGIAYTKAPTYVLSIHSSKPVLTDNIPAGRYLYSDTLYLLVEKHGKKHEGIPGVTCYYMSDKLAGLIVVAENRRSDVHLHVDCDCSESFNVVATRGSLVTNDCLPPLTKQVLTVLTQLEGSDGYSVSHKLKFRITTTNAYGGFGSHQNPLLKNGLSEIHNPRPL